LSQLLICDAIPEFSRRHAGRGQRDVLHQRTRQIETLHADYGLTGFFRKNIGLLRNGQTLQDCFALLNIENQTFERSI